MYIPPEPSKRPLATRIAAGAKLFTELGCADCHGNDGAGDERTASFDAWGFPEQLPNLRYAPYSGGESDADLYHRIRLGIPGTSMPAYPLSSKGGKKVSWSDVEALIAYLRSLRE